MKRTQAKASARAGFDPGSGSGSGFGFGGSGAGSGASSLSYLAEPPSFSAVSDPNVVVSLKNLLKKDSTTKAKALEDLLAYVQAHPFDKDGGVEEPVLDVWIQLYARISIDNSRRVRELSHVVQYELMKSARKRMEKHVPKVVGAWLGGVYDRDRVVARAASDGLASFLTTPEKATVFWRKCQSQILDFATEAIQETEDSLSDERSTTKEDAVAKYFRVVAASLSLMLGLLKRMETSDLDKLRPRYDDYFAEEAVWKSITFDDSAVRKATCQLLFACLDRKLPYAETTKAKQAFVTGGLKTNQAGSALEYVIALTKLTQTYPEIWVAGANEKKSPLTRLQAFIAKGSQGSPPKFWEYLEQLLSSLPTEALSLDAASALSTAVKSGVTNRDEPRTNTSFAWKCYIDTTKRLLRALSPHDQLAFAQQHLFPFFERFLFSVSDQPTPDIPVGLNALSIFVEAYIAILQCSDVVIKASEEEWNRLADVLSAQMSGSLPEVSKEYQKSQEAVAETGRRWFAIVGRIHARIAESAESIPDHTFSPSAKIISHSLVLLESRNMKPFSVAQILTYCSSSARHVLVGENVQRIATFLLTAAEEDIEKVIKSPAGPFLLNFIRVLSTGDDESDVFTKVWQTWIESVLDMPPAPQRTSALTSLISEKKISRFSKRNEKLQQDIVSQCVATVRAQGDAWALLETAVACESLDDGFYQKLAQEVVSVLEKESQYTENALKALEILAKGKPALFTQDQALQTALVAQLLSLSEINDNATSSKAVAIRALLDTDADAKHSTVGIIQRNLERVSPQSLEIDTLVEQAKDAHLAETNAEDVFPSTNIWIRALAPFLEQKIDPSLAITNNLGGAVAIVSTPTEALQGKLKVPRDRKGRSIPARMALYTSRLLGTSLDTTKLPQQFQVELLYLQCITVQLLTDQITSMSVNGLWQTLEEAGASEEVEEVISSLRRFINDTVSTTTWWTNESGHVENAVVRSLTEMLTAQARELNVRGLYSARAFAEIVQSVAEKHGASSSLEEKYLTTEVLKANPNTVLYASALITGLGETLLASKAASNFCNRLVSDVAGASAASEKTPIILVLLTLTAQIYETGELPVANNRIVFAVRQIISWLEEPEKLSAALSAEICRVLTQLLPCMKDVYGSYWEKALQFCTHLWTTAGKHDLVEALPFIHASLKLAKTLESIPEPNDDLDEALKEFAGTKPQALIELLNLPREFNSQPLEIVDSMLCREVEKIPVRYITDLSDIYGLVSSESSDIQTAAFTLLHKAIPAQQEQKSVDIMLDKTDARLPDELLSLLVDAPTLERYSDEALSQFPSPIRCYLLSWKLVFDTFASSSFKVRTDLTENLKTEKSLSPLLDFMFDVLGHSAAHALNLDKENIAIQQIRDYDVKLADAETGEKNMHWLLVHLFYLSLKYIPGLFRSWYIDCRSKQTRIAVESWTTKFFSPLIVADALDEVQTWADTQEPPAGDEKELIIKVSRTGKEVTAGYEVDEAQAAIVIKVPPSYPIEGVIVSSLNRVAVTERKWQSWIMTTQGVITFSNGNIIDGLQVFKRNIVGALKGQTECAICYSIISADKRMPDKRCGTCNNLFHRSCLYKWFQTSSQNTCPLCRNPIDYLGADTAKRRQN
ncbi:E3 ubiquitin-protein ligase listerin [Paramyrothecium foliicola]|nr:E3 ubiquitin-protein ligase listerin [Paramyrothecium foliicola]